MGKFYAVRNGRQTGVYNTWDDCKAQTSGYSGAQFKSFNTSQEAMEYMGGGGGGQRSHGTNGNSSSLTAAGGDTYDNFDDDDDFAGDTIYGRPVSQIRSSGHSEPRFEMYTDGACHGNGMAGARAGIGVHFPNRPDKDISEPLAGRQTNNRAEIQAARRALEVAKELGHSRVEIKTDSEFMNKSVNEWSHKWRQNNWRTSAGNDVINKQDFLDLEAASRGMDIKWTKVPAHSGVAGNEKADQLANQGVDKQPSRGDHSSRYQGSDIRRYT